MSDVYRIKPLVWHDGKFSSLFEDSLAMLHVVAVGTDQFEWWASTHKCSAHARPAKTVDEAKAAAEAWYGSKLLEALEVVEND